MTAQQPNPMDEFMIKRYELSALVGMTDGDLDYINVLDCTIGDLVHAISTRPHPPTPLYESTHVPTQNEFIAEFVANEQRKRDEHDTAIRQDATLAARKDDPKRCPYCGSGSMNKSHLCGVDHPPIFNGYYCTWCGTSFDDDMIILSIGHDHENSVEYERKKRAMKAWDYESLRQSTTAGNLVEGVNGKMILKSEDHYLNPESKNFDPDATAHDPYMAGDGQ